MRLGPRRQSFNDPIQKKDTMQKLTLSLDDLAVHSFDTSPAWVEALGTVHGNSADTGPGCSQGCPSANCSDQATCPVRRTCGPTCENVHTCGNDCLKR
jgi:hypothetical protein